jgi:DNA-binding transcriptional ArsR family regulator
VLAAAAMPLARIASRAVAEIAAAIGGNGSRSLRTSPIIWLCVGSTRSTRRAILARLALGETAVTELAEPFAISLPAVSKHLKVLEHAGLITRGREAQWRPCRIEPGALKDVDDWLEYYRPFWTGSFK